MKFNKELIQKAVLAAMFCAGGLWYYATEMLGPLTKRQGEAKKEITALEPKLKDAKSKILHTNAIQAGDTHAMEAQRAFAVLKAKIPGGQPVAWLPTRFAEFFKQQGIGKPTFRSNPKPSESDFLGYTGSSWTIDLSNVGFAAFGRALAALENQEGLMQITNLQLDSVATAPEIHHAQLTISTLVKSEK